MDRIEYWIRIDIANTAGKDKLSFDERIKWTQDNDLTFDLSLDSPWEFRNAVNALKSHLEGKKVNHMVYLDASNQALQLYAITTADKRTAMTCNIANGTHMADAYMMLAKAMNKLQNRIDFTRTNCKYALMTTMYGKADGSEEILDDIIKGNMDYETKSKIFAERYNFIYDEETGRCPELQSMFQQALISIAPKAVATMEALTEINKTMELDTYYWTLPDGFNVKYDVKYEETIEVEPLVSKKGLEIILPTMNIEKYGKDENSRGMSPNIIHSIDGYIVREMIRRMNGKFITTIHDAFACHPSDCDFMIQNYKDILCELLTSNILNDIVREISGMNITINKTGDLTCEDIQDSLYLLA